MRKLKLPKINYYLTVLVLVFAAIFVTNFSTTWYTGWDNLHPEFNFGLNISRALTSTWQANQGVGTYGGHGYGATLPHSIILFIMSIVIPDMFLRSIFTFICLLAGSVGIFYLVRKLVSNKNQIISEASALLGGIFYMLNYATIQNFYIQLEAFIVHYAAMPWLFFSLIKYLENRNKKYLFIFALITLITSTQGFIPPIFLVYIMLLLIFLFLDFLNNRDLKSIKSGILILFITILINSYWLFPVGYYTFKNSGTYLNSYNNISSTEDFLEKNKKYGTLDNIFQFKGFLSEAIDIVPDGTVFKVFDHWENHMNKKPVQLIGIGLFIFVLLGCIKSIYKRDSKHSTFFFIGFLLSLTFLATNTFPFSSISEILQNLPVFKQAFRISFTKFSLAFVFFCAVLFGIGVSAFLSLMIDKIKIKKEKLLILAASAVIFCSLIFVSIPTFTGNLLYSRTKINIPTIYFDLFKYFGEQNKNERIANLPQGWNWGWSVYKWGYSGSGFLWYGIEQPVMDRSFDVWGRGNENYYWEMTHAIFSQRFDQIDNIMEKYQVNWIIYDDNISPYLNPYEFLYVTELKNYLKANKKFTLVKTLSDNDPKTNDIYIYKVNLKSSPQNFRNTYSLNEVKNIGPTYSYNNVDYAFDDLGQYYTDESKEYDYYYLFRSLFDSRRLLEFPIEITETDRTISLYSNLPENVKNSPILLPPLDPNFYDQQPNIEIIGSKAKITFNKIDQDNYDSNTDIFFLNHKTGDCLKPKDKNAIFKQEATNEKTLKFTSFNSESCYAIILDRASQRSSYLIQIESKNTTGRQLQFAVINHDSRKADIDIKLPKNKNFEKNYLFLPPMKEYGAGYSYHFQNTAIGNQTAVNELKSIKSNIVPYDFLSGIVLINKNSKKTDSRILTYYQSFDSGWRAYEVKSNNKLKKQFPVIFGKKLDNHILVNNWANGWIYDPKSTNPNSTIIVYLPQYLQYLGYILSVGTIIVLLGLYIYERRSRKN